uniref:Uncharacterized protein n=1 Tax=Chrysotila carterae TaxID=13221 RepID=A0A7S4BL12_CHRCT
MLCASVLDCSVASSHGCVCDFLRCAFFGGSAHEDSFALEEETVRGFWQPVKFDAATAKDEDGLMEREIISYSGKVQMRWNVRQAKAAWQALNDGEPDAPAVFFGAAHVLENNVFRHMTVMDDLDIVALEGEIVRSLHF